MSKFLGENLKGLSPYVPGEQPKDKRYVKLNTNESPFLPSPFAVRLLRQAANDSFLYPDPEYKSLVDIAAEKYGVNSDEILFTNGSDEALKYAFTAFCDETTPAVFADITYGFYEVFAKAQNIMSKIIPLKDDLSIGVNDYINAGGTVFIANPNAPTGLLLSLSDIEKIVKGNPENVVVIDEAYIDFGGASAVSLIKKYDNLLVVQTFSKSRSLAGARIGFAMGNRELIKDLKLIKYASNPYNLSGISAAAAIGALVDEEYFKNNCKKIIATRERLKKELAAAGYSFTDSYSNFVFVKKKGLSGETIYTKLKEKGILVRFFNKPRISDYVRITVGSDEEIDALICALKEIAGV